MSTYETLPIIEELIEAQKNGEPVVLATVTKARGSVPRHAGSKMLIYENGAISGTVGGGEMESRVITEAQEALVEGQPRVLPYSLVDPQRGDPGVCGGEMEVYLEPYLPPMTIFVVGAGHVGQAVADLAHWLGYQVVVNDDREELATEEAVPNADVYLPGSIENALARHKITRNTYVVLLTRNVKIDQEILPHLVDTPAPYIAVMGSRRRWQHTKELLLEDGLTEEQLSRFHSPVGLELNAETPEEIAVSILAEIIMLRRQGTGDRMSG
ncbi:MAG TPA: XdhC/CoxI family protein [Candidatus Sulfomarinibacteraceae bacterium]|nr:XdhC/CoxI family protein [Candidatus Sulfomarinibacteraceae bacterium]